MNFHLCETADPNDHAVRTTRTLLHRYKHFSSLCQLLAVDAAIQCPPAACHSLAFLHLPQIFNEMPKIDLLVPIVK